MRCSGRRKYQYKGDDFTFIENIFGLGSLSSVLYMPQLLS